MILTPPSQKIVSARLAATRSSAMYVNRPRGIDGRVMRYRNRHTIGPTWPARLSDIAEQ